MSTNIAGHHGATLADWPAVLAALELEREQHRQAIAAVLDVPLERDAIAVKVVTIANIAHAAAASWQRPRSSGLPAGMVRAATTIADATLEGASLKATRNGVIVGHHHGVSLYLDRAIRDAARSGHLATLVALAAACRADARKFEFLHWRRARKKSATEVN